MSSGINRFRMLHNAYCEDHKSLYDGIPILTKGVEKVLNKEDLELLDAKIKSLIDARIEMFGARLDFSHGLDFIERFTDSVTKKVIKVTEIDELDREFLQKHKNEVLNPEDLNKIGNYIVSFEHDEYLKDFNILNGSSEKESLFFRTE